MWKKSIASRPWAWARRNVPPAGVHHPRCRAEPPGGEDTADRARADVVAQSLQLALDPAVSPARVVVCKASDQVADLVVDVHWEAGQRGRFLVQGKGANGSGTRMREAFLFAEGRELLWWYVEEIRGLFGDDALDPNAPLWPTERLRNVTATYQSTILKVIEAPSGRSRI
jgi:hypothetical protein